MDRSNIPALSVKPDINAHRWAGRQSSVGRSSASRTVPVPPDIKPIGDWDHTDYWNVKPEPKAPPLLSDHAISLNKLPKYRFISDPIPSPQNTTSRVTPSETALHRNQASGDEKSNTKSNGNPTHHLVPPPKQDSAEPAPSSGHHDRIETSKTADKGNSQSSPWVPPHLRDPVPPPASQVSLLDRNMAVAPSALKTVSSKGRITSAESHTMSTASVKPTESVPESVISKNGKATETGSITIRPAVPKIPTILKISVVPTDELASRSGSINKNVAGEVLAEQVPDNLSTGVVSSKPTDSHRPKGKQKAKIASDEDNPPQAAPFDVSAGFQTSIAEGSSRNKRALQAEHSLAGWDGKMGPPPIEWINRPSFNSKDKRHLRAVDAWMQERAQDAMNNPVTIDITDPGFGSGEALAAGEDELQSPIDSKEHDTRLPNDDFTHARIHQTAAAAAKQHRARVRVDKEETKADRKAYREAIRHVMNYVPLPNPHAPEAHVYIRPAVLQDMPKITALYNHYVEFSVVVPELAPMTVDQWQGRWEDATEASYAFLVAVQKSPKGGGYHRRLADEVVSGFAYADEYGSKENAWRHTCELQFFTAHWQLRAGIGKSLVDRMLAALDPSYIPLGGVTFEGGPDSVRYEQGGVRVISKIIISIPYWIKDDSDLKWQKQWLAQFGFEQMATFPKVGQKGDKE